MQFDDVFPRPDHVTRQVRWIPGLPETVRNVLHRCG